MYKKIDTKNIDCFYFTAFQKLPKIHVSRPEYPLNYKIL